VIIASQDRTSKDPTAADIQFKDNREHIVDPDLLKFAANSCTDITENRHYIADFRTTGVHVVFTQHTRRLGFRQMKHTNEGRSADPRTPLRLPSTSEELQTRSDPSPHLPRTPSHGGPRIGYPRSSPSSHPEPAAAAAHREHGKCRTPHAWRSVQAWPRERCNALCWWPRPWVPQLPLREPPVGHALT
jgi:hypothetical protein